MCNVCERHSVQGYINIFTSIKSNIAFLPRITDITIVQTINMQINGNKTCLGWNFSCKPLFLQTSGNKVCLGWNFLVQNINTTKKWK